MDSVDTELIKAIETRLHVTATESSKISELNLDSIKTADFLSELEYEFDVRFDQDVFDVETVADLAAYIRERLPEPSQ